ncbi:MAG: UDP-N-acetylglucosamine diphosphorylase [Verrucomicrobiales bacterium]|nr:UDP-N-acetylglucosamine diphosphorylase [Verrucomicrobiales bacterium]
MDSNFSASQFLNLDHCEHTSLFDQDEPVWAAIPRIADYLRDKLDALKGERLNGEIHERAIIGSDVYIGPGTVVEANAVIKGPAWIGCNCTIRSGAYVRENVIAGDNVMLGNSSEFKNCLLFNNSAAPHFNYIGDSILGHKAHLGAGVILSNVRLDCAEVTVRLTDGGKLNTHLKKFGAIIGDHCEIGCNSVLSPGSLLGTRCVIYPCTHWVGSLAAGETAKNS